MSVQIFINCYIKLQCREGQVFSFFASSETIAFPSETFDGMNEISHRRGGRKRGGGGFWGKLRQE